MATTYTCLVCGWEGLENKPEFPFILMKFALVVEPNTELIFRIIMTSRKFEMNG